MTALALLFVAWSIVGLIVGWDGREWAIVGFLALVSALLCLVLPVDRPVFGPIVFLSVLALGAVTTLVEDEAPKKRKRPSLATPTTPAGQLPRFQQEPARVAVRDWFDAVRKGDGAKLCFLETEAFGKRTKHCATGSAVKADPSWPASGELKFESLAARPGGAQAEVTAGDRGWRLTLEGGALFRVDGVSELDR
jgi:hypothetical protein